MEVGEVFPILPTAIVGNGKIMLAFRLGSSFNSLAWVGKGKEKGKMYLPGENRSSGFCDVSFVSEWRGLPIDLSHKVNSDDKNCKVPSAVAAKTTFPVN